MDTSKNGGKQNLQRGHNTQKDQAGRFMNALELIGNLAALKLRNQIRVQLQTTGDAVKKADTAGADSKSLRTASTQAEKDLDALVKGILGGVRLTDPALFAKLPDKANFPEGDPDSYADVLTTTLKEEGGKTGEVLGKLLHHGREKRLKAMQAYQHASDAKPSIQSGRVAMSDLGVLLKMAESLIHSSAAPGSPAYQLLKKPRAPKADQGTQEKKAKSGGATQQGGGTPASGESSTPASTPAPAPTPSIANEVPAVEPLRVAQ